jgi:hypothetical protein
VEHLGIVGTKILKLIIKGWYREAWTGLLWLRIGRSDGLL